MLLFVSIYASANPIDDKCPSLTYRTAPIVNADQYICHTEYALAYSWTSKNPIYTTELLTKDHTGNLQRTNDFRVDPSIDVKYQSTPKDYVKTICNGGRCDRGHMTPDQDFSSCNICVHESFFMSNMVPQNFKNNEVIWKHLEMLIRKYTASHSDGVYVITGPAYKSKSPTTIGNNKIWVPDLLWKIMIDHKNGKSIAFMMPNQPESDLSQFIVSIHDIEEATGITFDNSLDKTSIANFNIFLQAKD